jgi:hypothetical protein
MGLWLRAAAVFMGGLMALVSLARDEQQVSLGVWGHLDAPIARADDLVDLEARSLEIQTTGDVLYLGQSYKATIEVRNHSGGQTSGTWIDELYLSSDSTYDSSDKPIANLTYSGSPLGLNDGYTAQISFTVPSTQPGRYFIVHRTDANDEIAEQSEANNVVAVSVNIDYQSPPRPDLKPVKIEVTGGSLEAGKSATLRYTLKNVGQQSNPGGSHWSDAVYLSPDDKLSSTDQLLGTAVYTGGTLNPGDTYTAEVTVDIPGIASSASYVIIYSDFWNELLEASKVNNDLGQLVGVQASQPPAADPAPSITLTVASTTTAVPTATKTPTPTPTLAPQPTNTAAPTSTSTSTATPKPPATATNAPTQTPVPTTQKAVPQSAANTAPVTTAFVSPQPNAAGWNSSDVKVALNATAASGLTVKNITYSASGAKNIPVMVDKDGATSFDIKDEGITTITYFATDNAGNSESPKSLTVRLDKGDPKITASPSRPADGKGWYSKPVTITFSGSDTVSGIATCTAPVTYSGPNDDRATVTGTCTDRAGNAKSTNFDVKYDSTAPTTSATQTVGADGTVKVKLDPVDSQPSSAVAKLTYNATGAQPIPTAVHGGGGEVSIDIKTSGTTTITFVATDDAGNVEAQKTITVTKP